MTRTVVIEGQYRPGQPSVLTSAERYVPLQGQHRLELSILHEYAVIESNRLWSVHTAGYWYQVRQAHGPEVIAFHWHPDTNRSPIVFPHLHIGGATAPIDIGGGTHVPTGRVSIEAIIRFLITELHVRPLRADWDRILSANEAEYHANRG